MGIVVHVQRRARPEQPGARDQRGTRTRGASRSKARPSGDTGDVLGARAWHGLLAGRVPCRRRLVCEQPAARPPARASPAASTRQASSTRGVCWRRERAPQTGTETVGGQQAARPAGRWPLPKSGNANPPRPTRSTRAGSGAESRCSRVRVRLSYPRRRTSVMVPAAARRTAPAGQWSPPAGERARATPTCVASRRGSWAWTCSRPRRGCRPPRGTRLALEGRPFPRERKGNQWRAWGPGRDGSESDCARARLFRGFHFGQWCHCVG